MGLHRSAAAASAATPPASDLPYSLWQSAGSDQEKTPACAQETAKLLPLLIRPDPFDFSGWTDTVALQRQPQGDSKSTGGSENYTSAQPAGASNCYQDISAVAFLQQHPQSQARVSQGSKGLIPLPASLACVRAAAACTHGSSAQPESASFTDPTSSANGVLHNPSPQHQVGCSPGASRGHRMGPQPQAVTVISNWRGAAPSGEASEDTLPIHEAQLVSGGVGPIVAMQQRSVHQLLPPAASAQRSGAAEHTNGLDGCGNGGVNGSYAAVPTLPGIPRTVVGAQMAPIRCSPLPRGRCAAERRGQADDPQQ